jgi:hypothetical protein
MIKDSETLFSSFLHKKCLIFVTILNKWQLWIENIRKPINIYKWVNSVALCSRNLLLNFSQAWPILAGQLLTPFNLFQYIYSVCLRSYYIAKSEEWLIVPICFSRKGFQRSLYTRWRFYKHVHSIDHEFLSIWIDFDSVRRKNSHFTLKWPSRLLYHTSKNDFSQHRKERKQKWCVTL